MRLAAVLAAALVTMTGAHQVLSEPAKPARSEQTSPFMRVFGSAAAPYGFVAFCERMPGECAPHGSLDVRFEGTPARLSELDQINRNVNTRIAPATDLDLYGVVEHWTLPTEKGDCEDYALLKRQMLIKRGWPSSALLMTVVRDEQGDGHAVLTARTTQGDFILDNKRSDIRLWHLTGYRYVMRQSFVDPRLWMALSPDGGERYNNAPTSMQARR
jgi:predicted transglutaminase-like cysteine proteinase